MVHFFLSQLYADQKDLGIDPTMTLVSVTENQKPVYDVMVHVSQTKTVVCRTTNLLDQESAAAFRGRGTRVWDVNVTIDGVAHTGVLKDFWVDSDRMREGEILEKIRETQVPENDRDDFDATFLHVLAHGDVLIDGVADDTRAVITRNARPPSDKRFNLHMPQSRPIITNSRVPTANASQAGTSRNVAPQTIVPAATEPNLGPETKDNSKTRYRIVFLEKCTPLYRTTSLRTAFQALGNVVLGTFR